MTLPDLISRVEEGDGEDREIDLAVFNLFQKESYRFISATLSGWSHDFGYPESEFPLCGGDETSTWAKAFDPMRAVVVPHVADDLNAVVRLIETEFPDYEMTMCSVLIDGRREWRNSLRIPLGVGKIAVGGANKDGARALLAAFLRAYSEGRK